MTACTGRERQPAVPSALTEQATVLGIANARFWADTQGHEMVQEVRLALARERASQAQASDDAAPDAALACPPERGPREGGAPACLATLRVDERGFAKLRAIVGEPPHGHQLWLALFNRHDDIPEIRPCVVQIVLRRL